MTIRYEFLHRATSGDVADVNGLLHELAPHAAPITFDYFQDVVKETHFLAARDITRAHFGRGVIVGMGCLVPMRTPVGIRARIEDVVAAVSYRGQGIGKRITELLIEEARRCSCVCIDLTSHPSRVAANKLYQKLQFVQYETNVYRLDLAHRLEVQA